MTLCSQAAQSGQTQLCAARMFMLLCESRSLIASESIKSNKSWFRHKKTPHRNAGRH